MSEITKHLVRTGNCFNRIDQLMVVRDHSPLYGQWSILARSRLGFGQIERP